MLLVDFRNTALAEHHYFLKHKLGLVLLHGYYCYDSIGT